MSDGAETSVQSSGISPSGMGNPRSEKEVCCPAERSSLSTSRQVDWPKAWARARTASSNPKRQRSEVLQNRRTNDTGSSRVHTPAPSIDESLAVTLVYHGARIRAWHSGRRDAT